MNALRFMLILYFVWCTRSKPSRGVLRIYRFDEKCDGVDSNKTALRYLENKVVLVNNSYQIYFAVQVSKDIDSDLMFRIDTQRCQEKGGQCQPYQVLQFQKACKFLNMGSKPWSPLFNALEPPKSCPLKRGIYRMKRTETCDAAQIGKLPFMGNYLWKTEIRILRQDNNEILQCLQTDTQVIYL